MVDEPKGVASTMKLLFVHQKLGEFGGAEANLRLSAVELRSRGYELGLLYHERTGRNEALWRDTFCECFELPAPEDTAFVHSVLQQFAPDLVYLHQPPSLELLETILNSGLPVVRMVHDHGLYCMRQYKYDYLTRRICTRPLSPFCLFPCLAFLGRNPSGGFPIRWVSYAAKKREIALNQRCHRFVVYSQYLKQELVRNGFDPHKIELCVPLWLDSDQVVHSNFGPRNLILFAGQLIRGKGLDVLLHALAKVRTHFECEIFGDGGHRRHCEQLSRRLGLENRVRFRGYVLPAELAECYREASIFVMGSLWPEPFGMAGPEAMRHSLPVVAFDAGGIREWLTDGENGYLVPWKNAELFAARLEQLLHDKELARRLGRRGFETVQKYDCCRQVDRLEQVFQNVVHGRQTQAKFAPTTALL